MKSKFFTKKNRKSQKSKKKDKKSKKSKKSKKDSDDTKDRLKRKRKAKDVLKPIFDNKPTEFSLSAPKPLYSKNCERAISKIMTNLPKQDLSMNYHRSDILERLEKTLVDNMQHINGLLLNEEEFSCLYDQPNQPVIITKAMLDWEANNWTIDKINEKYPEINFLIGGSNSMEERAIIKFKYYYEYLKNNKDDSPLLLHDYGFNRRQSTKPLKDDYIEPSFFGKDYLAHMAEARRPPWRFFSISPKRSGLKIYRNLYKESKWDALLTGKRRYVLFEPDTPKDLIKGLLCDNVDEKYIDKDPIVYFDKILPSITQGEMYKEKCDRYEIIECLLKPGELLFIPSGWFYSYIALEDSISISQSF